MSIALSISALLFSVYGVLSLGVGLFVPFAFRASYAGHGVGPPGLFHSRPDAVLFGSRPLADHASPPPGRVPTLMPNLNQDVGWAPNTWFGAPLSGNG